jgi:hypothetical protein
MHGPDRRVAVDACQVFGRDEELEFDFHDSRAATEITDDTVA